MSGTRVADLLAEGASALPRRRGIPDPRREAIWLLARAWGRSETWVRLDPTAPVPEDVAARYLQWIERRRAGEPAHRLTGTCPFWGREFLVTPDVLIPRPETEFLVEAALALPLPPGARALDVGTGSGCLAVTLAAERPRWRVTATDRSAPALAVAAGNALRHRVSVHLVLCDLASSVRGPFELVVANLPYIPTEALSRLPEEVRHDPREALDGGFDGLKLVRRLVADLPRLLAPGGSALLELGEGQAEAVESMASARGLVPAGRIRDLGRCDRIVHLRAPA